MPCPKGSASSQINRLGSIPFFSAITIEARNELVSIAANECDDLPHLVRAIRKILDYAAGTEARVPTPREFRDILAVTREEVQPPPMQTGACGALYHGHVDQFGHTAQCRGGWVHIRQYRTAPKHKAADGSPLELPYDYAGRCACQPGGTLRPNV